MWDGPWLRTLEIRRALAPRREPVFQLFVRAENARRGFAAELITKAQLRAIERADAAGELPPQWANLGGQVGIHGFGSDLTELAKIFRATPDELDGTRGCIMILDVHIHQQE